MNIWILNHYAVPRNGTAGTVHAVVAHYLHEAGHQVTIFPGSHQKSERSACNIPDGQGYLDQFDGPVRFRYVRTRPFRNLAGRLANMFSYRRNVCRVTVGLDRPDVVIGSCVHPLAVDAGRRLAQRHGAAFIYQIRDIWPETLADMGVLSPRHPLYVYFRFLGRRALTAADGLTGVMPGIFRYAAEQGIESDRVCWLPNGFDPKQFPASEYPADGSPFVISYFGTIGKANAIGMVVEAAARLQSTARGRDVLIRLVGDGAEKAAIQAQVARLGLRNVELVAAVPKTQLTRLAEQSHAFIFPLLPYCVLDRYGLSSNKLFDYLMGGRPTIFACRSLNDPIAEAEAGISLGSVDATTLADAILQLRSLPRSRRREMGQNGRRHALEHYDLSKVAQRWEVFLKKALTGKPGQRRLAA